MKTIKFCLSGSGLDVKNVAEIEVRLMKRLLLKMEAGLMKRTGVIKECCSNGSQNDEKNVVETKAGVRKRMLLKWKWN